jgi:hypothetical protein
MEQNDLFRRKELFESEMSDSGADIRAVPEGYHAVTPWIISRLIEWIERMAYVQESLDRELGNRTR